MVGSEKALSVGVFLNEYFDEENSLARAPSLMEGLERQEPQKDQERQERTRCDLTVQGVGRGVENAQPKLLFE